MPDTGAPIISAGRPVKASWLVLAAKIAVSAGLLAVVLASQRLDEVQQRIASISSGALAAALAFFCLLVVLQAWRWSRVSSCLGVPLPLPLSLRLSLEAHFVNQVLPSTLGGDVIRGLSLGLITGHVRLALESVIADRVLGVASLALFVLMALPHLLWVVDDETAKLLFLGGAAAILIGTAVLPLATLLPARLRALPGVADVAHFGESLMRAARGRQAIELVTVSIVVHGLSGVIFWVMAAGSGIDLSLISAIALVPSAMLVTLIPLSIGGWGLREGAIVILLGSAGVAPADALALSISYGLIFLVISLIGAPLWLKRNASRPDLKQ